MKKAVITYGRFNPPTIGHERMFKKLVDTAKADGADPIIIVSHSQNVKKNPLSPGEKIRIIQDMVPEATVLQTTKQEFNPDFIIKRLRQNSNYTDFKMVVGGNRFNKGNFNWLKIKVVSGGARNKTSGNAAAGMSATNARAAAVSGNRPAFRRAISARISNGNVNSMMQAISARMTAPRTARKAAKTPTTTPRSGKKRRV